MSKGSKHLIDWQKEQTPKPKEDERTFDRKEVIKALIRLRKKRPLIKTGA